MAAHADQANDSDGSPLSSPPQSSSSGLSSPPLSSNGSRAGSPMDVDPVLPASPIASPGASSASVTDSSDNVRVKPKAKFNSRGKGKGARGARDVESSDADDSEDAADGAGAAIDQARRSRQSILGMFSSAPGFDTRLPLELMTDITVEELIAYYPLHVFHWPGLALLVTHYMMRCGVSGKWTNKIMNIINESRGFTTAENMIRRHHVREWLQQTIRRSYGEHYSIKQLAHDNALKVMLTNEPDAHSMKELLNKHLWNLPVDRKKIIWKDPVNISQLAQSLKTHPEGHFAKRVLAIASNSPWHMPAPLASGTLHPIFASIPENSVPLPSNTLATDSYPIHLTPIDVLRLHWKDLNGDVFLYVLKEYTLANVVPMYMEVAGIDKKDEKNTNEALRKRRERALRLRAKRNGTSYQIETVEFALEMHAAGHFTVKPRNMTEDQIRRWRETHPVVRVAETAIERLAKLRNPEPRGRKRSRSDNTPPALPVLDGEEDPKETAKRRKTEKQAQKAARVAMVAAPMAGQIVKQNAVPAPALVPAPAIRRAEKVWDPVAQSWKYPDANGFYVIDAPLQVTDSFLDELLPPLGLLTNPTPFDPALIDPILIDVPVAPVNNPESSAQAAPALETLTEEQLFALFLNDPSGAADGSGPTNVFLAHVPGVGDVPFPPRQFVTPTPAQASDNIGLDGPDQASRESSEDAEDSYGEGDYDIEMYDADESSEGSVDYPSGSGSSSHDSSDSSSGLSENNSSPSIENEEDLEEAAAHRSDYYLSIMAGASPDDDELDDLESSSISPSDRDEPVVEGDVPLDYGEDDSNEPRRPLGIGVDYGDAEAEAEDLSPGIPLNLEDDDFLWRLINAGIEIAPVAGIKRKERDEDDNNNEAALDPAELAAKSKKLKTNDGAALPAAGLFALPIRPRLAPATRTLARPRTLSLPIRATPLIFPARPATAVAPAPPFPSIQAGTAASTPQTQEETQEQDELADPDGIA